MKSSGKKHCSVEVLDEAKTETKLKVAKNFRYKDKRAVLRSELTKI